MTRRIVVGIVLAALCAFAASSLWYSPVLCGRQFLALSAGAASARPEPLKIAAELLRNLLLASAICWLIARQRVSSLRSLLALAGVLWVGFPLILLSGSVLWQNVPPELALIHSGDWLIKILLMTLIPWLMNHNAEGRSRLSGRTVTVARIAQPN